ncbi:hypothetical protein D3C78_1501840 [compost metagenome]
MGQVAAENQGDLRLDLRLQDAFDGDALVVAVAHVGEQGAEVRLADAELGLHLGIGQADLASHHAAPGGLPVFDVDPLDRIGGFAAVFLKLRAQRLDGLAVGFRRAQRAGQLLQQILFVVHRLPRFSGPGSPGPCG